MFLFPPAVIPILIISTIVSVSLSALAIEYWLDSNFGDHKPLHIKEILVEMGELKPGSNTLDFDHSPHYEAPYHGSGLFPRYNTAQNHEYTNSNNEDLYSSPVI
jgi:hypothetical protein